MKNSLVLRGMVLFQMVAWSAHAATYSVNSIAALQSRINSAVAGDRIIVADGTYTTSAALTVNRVGTAAQPIVIEAATVGGVTIAGTHGFTLNSPAAHIHIQGFRFAHAADRNTINSGATFCRFTRNIFECTGSGNYLLAAGDDAEIDRNEFRNKSTVGNMIDVRGSGSQIARRVRIHRNYFHDFTSAGVNGAETIRFGLSGLSMSTGNGIVEYNLFVRCRGENELISNKASGITYRYNTFLESAGAQLTLRHGNDCLAYGNYFRGTDGLRVYGDRNLIFSNYFEGNTKGVDMGNGDGEVADGAALTCHDRPDDCVVAFNTFINNSVHYQMGGRTGGLGATNITVANNIFQGGGSMAGISTTAPYTGTWSGNIRWNTGSAGNMPSSGYQTVNPLLAAGADGVYHLQAGSPAIGAAVGSYPFVTVDMDGQPRDGAPDTGADEFSAAPVVAKRLTPEDVGPFADLFPIDPATPTDQAPIIGSDAVFTVVPLAGAVILSYQWVELTPSGEAAIGTDAPTLTLPRVRKIDAGRKFFCRITTDKGTFTSRTAQLRSPLTALAVHLNFDDGTAADSSGNDNHGVLKNGASIVNDPDRGSVLNLDGVDDYVDLGTDGSLNLSAASQATLAAWVKMAATKNHNALITKGEWKDAYSLVIKGDAADVLWTGNDTSVFSADSIVANQWMHAAVVIDGRLATFYVNGEVSGPVNQDRGGPIDNISADHVEIGREDRSDDGSMPRWYFDGRLDDVRIYARALTASEIQSIVNPPLPGDINRDGKVNIIDFGYLSTQWVTDGAFDPSVDIAPDGGDGWVDLPDLMFLIKQWLMAL
jgi:hypothetical protein